MYAIIETGGKQVKVATGDVIYVEKLDVAEGEDFVFDKVLLVGGIKAKVGTPYVKGATVSAKVVKHGLNRKIKYSPTRTKVMLDACLDIVNHILALKLWKLKVKYD